MTPTEPNAAAAEAAPAMYEVLDYIGVEGRKHVPGDLICEPEDNWQPSTDPVASGDAMVLLRFEDPLGNRWAVTHFGSWQRPRAVLVRPPSGLGNHESAGRIRRLDYDEGGIDWGQLHRRLAAEALVAAGVFPQLCEAYTTVLAFYPPDGGTLAEFVERLRADRPDLFEAIQARAPRLIEEANR